MLRVPISQNYLSRLNLMVLNPIFKWIKGFAKEKHEIEEKKRKERKDIIFRTRTTFPTFFRLLITTINRSMHYITIVRTGNNIRNTLYITRFCRV